MASRLARRASAATYRGSVKAVVFDWAGTLVDYGSLAPVKAMSELFKKEGIDVDEATARGPMGRNKKDHIMDILKSKHIEQAWFEKFGSYADDEDVAELYAAFGDLMAAQVTERATPIPGVIKSVGLLRAMGVKLGSCSGYDERTMSILVPAAKKHGLELEAVECGNASGSNGRPKPWMTTRVAEALDAYPLQACVKVDDSLPGIAEGLNAGCWTVGVTKTGNEMGLEEAQVAALAPAELTRRLGNAKARFESAGAHYVVESVADLPAVVDDINERMSRGEHPMLV